MTASFASVHLNNMQQQKSFIGHILSSSFEVDLTALPAMQIGQNGPKTTNQFFPKVV